MIFDVLRDLVSSVRLVDLIDICIVSAGIYSLIRALRTTRAGSAFLGILIVSAGYLASRILGLRLLTSLLQGFFAATALGLIVIFQDEIRRFLDQVARRGWRRKRKPVNSSFRTIEIVAQTAFDLARDRVGASIVIEGRDHVSGHTHGGIDLDSKLSEPLLKSLFDPHSVGHDGAVVVERGRVARFCCHLPLSRNDEELAGRGTRHASALGLSECCDAFCLVVSEERGVVSIARSGRLIEMPDSAKLISELEGFFAACDSGHSSTEGRNSMWRRCAGAGVSVIVSLVLWFLLIREGELEYRTYSLPVGLRGLGSDVTAEFVGPSAVRAIVSAARREFYFVEQGEMAIEIKLFDVEPGEREFTLTAADVVLPPGLSVVNLIPRTVTLRIAPLRAE